MRRRLLGLLIALPACGGEPAVGPHDGPSPAPAVGTPEHDRPDAPPGAPRVRAEESFTVRATRDLVYARALRRDSMEEEGGTPVDLTLSAYEPVEAEGPRPAAVCFIGGGFTGSLQEPGGPVIYSKKAMMPFARHLATRGWVVFLVDYRLADDHGRSPDGWPGPPGDFNPVWHRCFYPAIRDGKAAVRWIHVHAERFSVSEDHIAVLGGSAGAAIGIALGISDPEDFTRELTPEEDPTLPTTNPDARSDVQAVVVFWGPTVPIDDLERIDGRSRYDAGDAAFAVVHGEGDPIIPFSFGTSLRDACREHGIPCEFHAFDGSHAAWSVTIDGMTLPELTFDFLVRHQELDLRSPGN